MKVICAYCHAHICDKEPLHDERVSHGMCDPCHAHFNRHLDGQSLGEYLDNFPCPILATNGDGRVLAANQQMAEMLGHDQRALAGLLGGEVIECVHARLPGGCGQTVHCDACTIRKAIRHTLNAGAPLHRQRAYVERHDGRLDVWISTYPVGQVVKLVIDSRAR